MSLSQNSIQTLDTACRPPLFLEPISELQHREEDLREVCDIPLAEGGQEVRVSTQRTGGKRAAQLSTEVRVPPSSSELNCFYVNHVPEIIQNKTEGKKRTGEGNQGISEQWDSIQQPDPQRIGVS